MFERKALAFCGWCGILSIITLVVGMGPLAQLTPPPSPMITAAEVATHLQQHAVGIQWGMFLANIGVALSIAMCVGISMVIRRIEAPGAPVLSYVHMMCGVTASLFLMLPVMVWSVAAFRPVNNPDTLMALHDMATFFTFLPFSVATLEAWVVAYVIFADKRSTLYFPRWLGVYTVVYGFTLVPMGLIGLFKDGAWASNGLMGWWVPTIFVAPWYLMMSICVIRAAGKTEAA